MLPSISEGIYFTFLNLFPGAGAEKTLTDLPALVSFVDCTLSTAFVTVLNTEFWRKPLPSTTISFSTSGPLFMLRG